MSEFKILSEEELGKIELKQSGEIISGQILIPLNDSKNKQKMSLINQDKSLTKSHIQSSDEVNENKSINSQENPPSSIKRPKRSPRPPPSSSLIEAKMNAQRKKQQEEAKMQNILVYKDHLEAARESKDKVQKETGVVFDTRMIEHKCLWDANYPERPERFSSIINRCQELGLFDRCKVINSRSASEEEILAVHTKEHIDNLKNICKVDSTLDALEKESSKYDAIYFHNSTYKLSLLSVGCTVDLINSILDDKIQNGMAIIRPPGHHAMTQEYCGYCYFNNVAIATRLALSSGKAKKILIVDWDVHHGQATQQEFYNDPNVLYFSTHRFEHGLFWPNLEESDYNFIGSSEGIGFNCNIPLNKIGAGNSDFLSIWHQILLPLAYQFNPDLVIVSAGYDSCIGDEKGDMEVTPQCYPHLLWPLMNLANGKVAVILEGGYCLKSLSESCALTLRSLLGDPCPLIQPLTSPFEEIVKSVMNASYMLNPYWSHLVKQNIINHEEMGGEDKLHIPSISFKWNEPKPEKYLTRDCYPIQNEQIFKSLDERLDKLILNANLGKAKYKVGLLFDEVMLNHRNMAEPHPERPERISNIFACHVDFNLVERCHRIQARKATEEELSTIHTSDHIQLMKKTRNMTQKELNKFREKYNSVFFNSSSYVSALFSAGSLIEMLDSVINQEIQSGIAIIRPPGHHAEIDEACGFCLFNNVAIAAEYALQVHSLKRILIVDWDVHHGNGIQRIFKEDPRVLYISIHRYDHGTFFPSSTEGNYKFVGGGKGEGYNVNIPWNGKGMGDTEYLAAFTSIVLPIAYEFSPELVLVSAGFDAANGDPLGGCKVSPEGYAHMTRLLSSLAGGRIILALEGGYNLTSISYSMTLCTKALLGDPIPQLTLKDKINPSALESIRNTTRIHSYYWKMLAPFQKYLPEDSKLIKQGSYVKDDIDNLTEQLENIQLDREGNVISKITKQSLPKHTVIPDPPLCSGEPSTSIPNTIPTTANVGIHEPSAGGNEREVDLEAFGAVGGQNPNSVTMRDVYLQMAPDNNANIDDSSPMFLVSPLKYCPHLENMLDPVPYEIIDTSLPCEECRSVEENWICLKCYTVHCSRFIREHMLMHSIESGHKVSLSFRDLSVWCCACDAYLDCEILNEAKNAAHRHKFGESLPNASFSETLQ